MKHVIGHNAEVKITKELLAIFREDAINTLKHMDEIYAECGLTSDKILTEAQREDIIQGQIISAVVAYKRNNGVPPIAFPVSFSSVDMAAWTFKDGDISPTILLGRKPGQTEFQFPGGFRDPRETNAEAAKRELNEETQLDIAVDRFECIDQLFIDDKRYRHTPHKITTTLFNIHLSPDEMADAKPGDDLEEVKTFLLADLIKDSSIIRDIHRPLFEMLWKYLLSVPDQSRYITPKEQRKA